MSDAQPSGRDAQRHAAAERMRLSRARRKQGQRIVPVAILDGAVDALVRAGLLDADRQGERRAIGTAIGRLFGRLPPGRWPALLGRSFPPR